MAHLDTGLMEEHISLSHMDMQTLTHYVHERLHVCVEIKRTQILCCIKYKCVNL